MQIKLKGKVIYRYSVRRLVYALCFLLFSVIDQRVKTEGSMVAFIFRDLVGVVMAVIIMTHYRLEDFRKWKIPYLVWTAAWIIGTPIAFFYRSDAVLLLDWLVIAADVVLFGYILIHTFISAVIEKKRPKLNLRYGAVWLVMMVLMIVSRSTYIWPFCYLVMFGCFYLTDFTQEEQNDLFQGMLDGIILGFFVLQGFCFVFRPYDEPRYKGVFVNCNINAMYYLIVLTVVFIKIIYVTRTNGHKCIKLFYWVGAGMVLSLELLTIGRTGWMTAALLSLAFCFFLKRHQVVKRAWRNLLVLLICVVITFPVTFGAVRYLPPLFHHPVWFFTEWNEKRVHSWDPWDSEKYVDIDEYFNAAMGRVLQIFRNVLEHSPFLMKADAAGADLSDMEPVLTKKQRADSLLVRGTIYKYYFQHLNLRGHPYAEQGFQLHETYWVPHAHNIFLQYGTDFGIPVMILFAVLIIWGAILLGRRYKQRGLETDAGFLMFLLVPAIFGLFEYSWGTGSLSILMMYFAWREVVCGEKE
ncbi:MAG: hypothetical protein J1E01_00580 [Acetatifactor sp.]|nr:hypothetical protein [Acetatifactor sp.]